MTCHERQEARLICSHSGHTLHAATLVDPDNPLFYLLISHQIGLFNQVSPADLQVIFLKALFLSSLFANRSQVAQNFALDYIEAS